MKAPGIDINAIDSKGRTVLERSLGGSIRRNIKFIEQLLSSDEIELNRGYTHPLAWAFRYDVKGIQKKLLANPEINLNYQNPNGETILMDLADEALDVEAFKAFLVVPGLKLDLQDKYGNTVLHVIVSTKAEYYTKSEELDHCFEMVKLLIQKGAKHTIRNKENLTPQELAEKNGYVEIANYLKSLV